MPSIRSQKMKIDKSRHLRKLRRKNITYKLKKNKTGRSNRKKLKGGCGCDKPFFGGNSNALPNTSNDPSREIISTRILPNMIGGKRKSQKNRKIYKKSKILMKGGSAGVLMGTDLNLKNPISSFGNMVGSLDLAKTVTGDGYSNAPEYEAQTNTTII
jgi:hypothetical protein